MHDEDDFLRKLLENPADDTVRLVYADWLDERDDTESKTKALFLRLTVRLREPNRKASWRKARRKEMRPLAATLPTDWLAVVSRLQVERCAGKRAANARWAYDQRLFDFVCGKRWDEMTATEDHNVRFCELCKEDVHYCDTITQAREHAQQEHCVAVDLGIIRREGDLLRPVVVVGRPGPEWYKWERNWLQVDAVSRERELQKQKKGNATTEEG